jgi:hypothetical protein
MSYVVATMLAVALGLLVSVALTAVARRPGRAGGGVEARGRAAAPDAPLAPTRHVRLVRMSDLSS